MNYHFSVKQLSIGVLLLLLIGCPNEQKADEPIPFSQLRTAVKRGNLAKVKEFTHTFPEQINTRIFPGGKTALHQAIRDDQQEIVELLLKSGADPNIVDSYGWTPLHCAAANGRTDAATSLLQKDANMNHRGSQGETPLHWAVNNNQRAMTELLINAGAQLNLLDHLGRTPLDIAIRQNHLYIIKLLRNSGGLPGTKLFEIYDWIAPNKTQEKLKTYFEQMTRTTTRDNEMPPPHPTQRPASYSRILPEPESTLVPARFSSGHDTQRSGSDDAVLPDSDEPLSVPITSSPLSVSPVPTITRPNSPAPSITEFLPYFSRTTREDPNESIMDRTKRLITQLQNGDKAAKGQLSKIRDEDAFPVLLEALNHPNVQVRETVTYMMRWFKRREAVAPLGRILQHDPDAGIRQTAALSLGLLEYEEAGPFLLQGLHDPHPRVMQMAIRGLGFLRYQGAIDLLRPKLEGDNEKDWFTQHEAAEALQKITGKDWSHGIHKYPPDFRVYDEQLTQESAERALGYLTSRLPDLIRTAETVKEIQNSEFYYIGYWNSVIQLEGYLLKQEVLLAKMTLDHVKEVQRLRGTPAIHPEAAEVAYEKVLRRYNEFLADTGWHD